MRRRAIDPTTALPIVPQSAGAQTRYRRGRRNHFSGIAAEEAVARLYLARGANVIGQRVRTPEGELDLVVLIGETLVFVEVKKRSRHHLHDSPISRKQWDRLENAALHYMVSVQDETGVHPVCRFDVALVAPDGSVDIIENARSFDEQ
ncbi:MAG: YraN family protein [Pseudomonadota bacterium]